MALEDQGANDASLGIFCSGVLLEKPPTGTWSRADLLFLQHELSIETECSFGAYGPKSTGQLNVRGLIHTWSAVGARTICNA